MIAARAFLLRMTVILALGSLAGTPAHADVLELGPKGARWVAGGPAPAPQAPTPQMPMGGPDVAVASMAQLIAALPKDGVGVVPTFSPLSNGRVTSNFGIRTHPILGGRRMHTGIDLAAATGTPVFATAMGVVTNAGWRGSYGLLVQLDHANSHQTRYGHLSRLAVQPGQIVEPGQLIGYVGSTGRSTGPHLHYEVRIGGKAVDPRPYMTGQ